MNDKIKTIKKRVERYNVTSSSNERYAQNQKRLRVLVEEHGIEAVALASSLSEKTVQQYVRVSVAPAINDNTITRAEQILKGL